ncbi:MAG: hypothetical protein ACRDOB_08095 [Streptosporangiaceae bacterium]
MTTPENNFLSSEHWVHFTDSQQREVYVLSGTCVLDPALVGPQDGSRWQRGQTQFAVRLRDLPEDQGLVVQQWAPTVVLGSIQNDGVANNAGWAVDDFDLESTGDQATQYVYPVFNYAVGDTDGQLRRVAYTVTVVGYYAQLPVIQ